MPSNVKVQITAEVVDLQAKMAIAKAELASASSALRALGKDAAESGGGFSKLSPELLQAAENAAKAKTQVSSLSTSLKRELNEGASSARSSLLELNSALGAIGLGVSVGGLLSFASGIEKNAAAIQHEAEVLGLTTDAYQAFAESAKLAGVDQDTADTAIRKFVDSLGKAQNGNKELQKDFDQLGVSWLQAADTALPAVSYALSNMTEANEQARISVDLMGRSGQEMRPVLDAWANGVDKMVDQLKKMNLYLSGETTKAAHDADIAWTTAGDALKVKFTPFVVAAYGAVGTLVDALGDLSKFEALVFTEASAGAFGGEQPAAAPHPLAKPKVAPDQVEDIEMDPALLAKRDEDNRKLNEQWTATQHKMAEAAKEAARKAAEAWKQEGERIVEFDKSIVEQLNAISKSHSDADIQIAKMAIDEKKSILEQEVAAGTITNAQKLQQLFAFADLENDLDIATLKNQQQNLNTSTADYIAQYDHLGDEIRVAEEKKREELAASGALIVDNNKTNATLSAKAWEDANNVVISSEKQFVSGIFQGRQNLGQLLVGLARDMAQKEITANLAYLTEKGMMSIEGANAPAAKESGGLAVSAVSAMFGSKTPAAGVPAVSQAGETAALQGNTTAIIALTQALAAHGIGIAANTTSTGANTISTGGQTTKDLTHATITAANTVGVGVNTVAHGASAASTDTNMIATTWNTIALWLHNAGVPGFASGAIDIPRDMLANIHKGEIIIPARESEMLRAGRLSPLSIGGLGPRASFGGSVTNDNSRGGDTHRGGDTNHFHISNGVNFESLRNDHGARSAFQNEIKNAMRNAGRRTR
jgi:hypothetical protein